MNPGVAETIKLYP